MRIRHSVLATARAIESEANQIAPDFVKNQGTIGIEVLPVSVWGPGQHRVRATFTESEAEQRDLRVVGPALPGGRLQPSGLRAAALKAAARLSPTQVAASSTTTMRSDRSSRRLTANRSRKRQSG